MKKKNEIKFFGFFYAYLKAVCKKIAHFSISEINYSFKKSCYLTIKL